MPLPKFPFATSTNRKNRSTSEQSRRNATARRRSLRAEQLENRRLLASDLLLSTNFVEEKLPVGTQVGQLTTNDPAAALPYTFEFVPGEGDADNSRFMISSGELQTAEPFDDEVKNEYSVRIRATDAMGVMSEATFVIDVLDTDGEYLDVLGTDGNDAFLARYIGSGTNQWEVRRGGTLIHNGPLASETTQLRFLGSTGTDTLTIYGTSSNDAFNVDNWTTYVNSYGAIGQSVESRRIFAGGGSDTLTGPNTNSLWTIDDLNDGTLNTSTLFYDMESLVGGSADDTFKFTGGRFDYIAGTLDSGDGWDTLDYSEYLSSDSVFVSWNTDRASGVGGTSWAGYAGTVTNFEAVLGSGGTNQTVEGPDAVNSWTIDGVNTGLLNAGQYTFSNVARIQGGPQADTFRVETTGEISGYISGGAADSIVIADRPAPLTVDLRSRRAPGAVSSFNAGTFLIEGADDNVLTNSNGSTSLTLNADGTVTANNVRYASGFAQFVGTELVESLYVPLDASSDWFITGEDNGYVLVDGNRFDFSGLDNAHGSNLADTFTVEAAGLWNGRLYGNSGNDSFHLAGGQVVGGIYAGGGSDMLLGPDSDSVWTIDDINDGTLNGIPFYDIGSLVGGAGDDTFRFTGYRFDYLSGTLDAGAGWDTLDYSLYTSTDSVFVSWNTNRATGVGGTSSSGYVGTVTNFEAVLGSGATNQTVEGPDAVNSWSIDGINTGSLNAGQYTFTNVARVQGGPQVDTFRVETTGQIAGRISGSGEDTIELADRVDPVNVNLRSRVAAGIVGGFFAGTFLIEGADDNVLTSSNGSTSLTLNADGTVTANSVRYTSGFAQFVGTELIESLSVPLDASSDWFITGEDTGYVVVNNKRFDFSGLDNAYGSNLADSFTVQSGGSLSGNVYGNSGDDIFDLGGGTIGGRIYAGGGADTLVGPDTASVWTIDDPNDGTLNTMRFYDIASLVGGAGDDIVRFVGYSRDYITGTLDTGDGWDTLDYSQYYDNYSVSVSWATDRATGVGGSSSNGYAGRATNFESVLGSGSTRQTVEGPDAVNLWTIDGVNTGSLNAGQYTFTNVARVHGGPQADTFRVETTGEITGYLGGSSADVIEIADRPEPISVNVRNRAIAGILSGASAGELLVEGGDDNLLVGGNGSTNLDLNADGTVLVSNVLYSAGFSQFAGTESIESIYVPLDVESDWFITGEDAGYIQLGDERFDFSGLDNAFGSNLVDTFTVQSGGSLSGNIYGDSGNDTFALRGGTIGGRIYAGGGSDTLMGPDTASVWTIDDPNDGTLNTMRFYDLESLVGGAGDDTFKFVGYSRDYITGTLDSGEGWDTLDYSEYYDNYTVFVSWATDRATGVGGTSSSGYAGRATNFEAVLGSGSTSQTVEGPGASNVWTIDGVNSGSLSDGAYGFTNVSRLQGGAEQDTFRIEATGSYSGSFVGSGGADLLELADRGAQFDLRVNSRDIPGVLDYYSVENVVALAPADGRLLGSNANTNWQVTSTGDISVNSVNYSGFGSILGGSGDDTLLVDYSGDNLDDALNIAFDGGPGGNDGLGFSGGNFDSVAYDPAQGELQLGDVAFDLSTGYLINLTNTSINNLTINVDQENVVSTPITTTTSVADTTDTLISFSGALGSLLVRNVTGEFQLNGDSVDDDTLNIGGIGSSIAADVSIDGRGGTDSVDIVDATTLRANSDIEIIAEQVFASEEAVLRSQGAGQVRLFGDAFSFAPTSSIVSGNLVAIAPLTANQDIELGGTDATALDLPQSILERIESPAFVVGADLPGGVPFSGDINVTGDTSFANPTNLTLQTAGNINLAGSLATSGAVSLQPGSTVYVGLVQVNVTATDLVIAPGSDLHFTINGLSDEAFSQLGLTGALDLTNVGLTVEGLHTPATSEVFLLIDKQDSGLITGNFSDLPESAVLANVLGTEFGAEASYAGSSGNDFTLTITDPPNRPPVAAAGGSYTVNEGGAVQLSASQSTDPDLPEDTLTYTWDLDGDGVFGETGSEAERGNEQGLAPTFSADLLDGPSSITVGLQVFDAEGAFDTTTATIQVQNVAPTISFASDSVSVREGELFTVGGSFTDPGSDDWTATVNYADGSGGQVLDLSGNTFQLSHAYSSAGVYSVIVTVDDGDGGVTTKRVSIDVSPPLRPDLALISSDVLFDPINPAVGDNINFEIAVHNEGLSGAADVPVSIEVFDADNQAFAEIGRGSIASIAAGAEDQLTFIWDGSGEQPELPSEDSYLLVRVTVDPDSQVDESEEANNSAIQVLQVGSPDFGTAELTGSVSPRTTTRGSYVGVGGQVFYDFETIPGEQDFPVQNASVTTRLLDSSTGEVLRVLGTRSSIDGSFGNLLRAPEIDGDYTLEFEVNDGTLSAVFETTLTVAGEPSTPPPSGRSPGSPGYVFSPSVQFGQPAVPPGNPQIGESMTIIGSFDYELDTPLLDVPVTFNNLFPVAGQLRTFEIGSSTVSFPDGGQDEPALLDIEWVPTAEGYHIIQVVAEPDFNFRAQTRATRLLLVGDLDTESLNVEYDASVVSGSQGGGEGESGGGSSSQAPAPGDTLRFTLTYENTGNNTITGGSLMDDFDEALVSVPTNISDGGIVDGNVIRWELGDIAPGESGSVTYEVTVKSGAEFPPGSAYLLNTAILNADQSVAASTNEVVITNNAPVITQLATNDISSTERSATLTGSFSDASAGDSHTVFIEWGDGNSDSLNLTGGERTFAVDHVYAYDPPVNGDRYEILVRVTDSASQSIERLATTWLTSQLSTQVVANSVSVSEGQAATNLGAFTDATTNNVTFTASVGSVSSTGENNGQWTWVSDSATTADDSVQVVTVTASDGVAVSTIEFDLTVGNVPVEFELGQDANVSPAEQGAFSRTGISFIDPGADVWSGTVDYGDGTGEQPLTIYPGSMTFDLEHEYTSSGSFPVTVKIRDDDSGYVSDSIEVSVQLEPPTGPRLVRFAESGFTALTDALLAELQSYLAGSLADMSPELLSLTESVETSSVRKVQLLVDGVAWDVTRGVELLPDSSHIIVDPLGNKSNENLVGTASTDFIFGRGGADTIVPGAGLDLVFGGSGNDRIQVRGSENENDLLVGGSNFDILLNIDEHQSLVFQEFNSSINSIERIDAAGESILGTSSSNVFDFTNTELKRVSEVQTFDGSDSIRASGKTHDITYDAGSGNDLLFGNSRRDILIGGEGDDELSGQGNSDILRPGPGDDEVDAGAGNDIIEVFGDEVLGDTLNGGPNFDILFNLDSGKDLVIEGFDSTINHIERIHAGGAFIVGTDDENWFDFTNTELKQVSGVSALGGADTVYASGKTHDVSYDAGPGDDVLRGNSRRDILIGGIGNDAISGHGNSDILRPGAGVDTVDAGAGNDLIEVYGSEILTDVLIGGPNFDVLVNLDGSQDMVMEHFDSSSISIERIHASGASIVGTEGDNWFDFTNTELKQIAEVRTLGGTDTISASKKTHDVVYDAGAGNDILVGNSRRDVLIGGAGDDSLAGHGNSDVLRPGPGKDAVDAGAGNDRIEVYGGEIVADTLIGGPNFDILVNLDGSQDLVMREFDSSSNSIERILAAGASVVGTEGNDLFDFTNTELKQLAGVFALGGTDTIYASNQTHDITYDAGDGDDTLVGNSRRDILIAGPGVDVMTGGGNADRFVISVDSGVDRINDLKRSQGDKVDLTALAFAGWSDFLAQIQATNTDLDDDEDQDDVSLSHDESEFLQLVDLVFDDLDDKLFQF